MPLHIVIDACHIRDFGIGTYIRNLIHSLARLDRENRYTVVIRPQDAAELADLAPNFKTVFYRRPDTEPLHNIAFPRFIRAFHADLCHIPLNYVAWWMPRPYVLTIHDMGSILFPARRDLRHTLHEEHFRRGARLAARVITVSNSTRQDVENVLRVPASHIQTIYSAPDPAFTAADRHTGHDRQTLDRYSVRQPFILYAGAIRPQKNIPRLIEAFAVLRSEFEHNPQYRDLRLIVIGDELSKYPAVRRTVVETRVGPAVRFLGFVPIETLKVFYRAAAVFAFPSLYEGFGLAPLEAMACGTPVVASSIPPLVEAVGDAAEMINPDNVFDIARGLREVLLDESRRARLVEAGLAQVKKFNWDHAAREVLSIYRAIKK